ncbi:MAG: S8 family serine peptidase [Lachnospiraceae bacterium]|nr:S8 family serine peptidase [Lachnospiraceae bacterium]
MKDSEQGNNKRSGYIYVLIIIICLWICMVFVVNRKSEEKENDVLTELSTETSEEITSKEEMTSVEETESEKTESEELTSEETTLEDTVSEVETTEDSKKSDYEDKISALIPSQLTPKKEVKIGLVDSGISTAAIAEESVLKGYNYITNNDLTDDSYNHGTKSAAIILRYAPEVKLVPLVCVGYHKGELTQVDNDCMARIIKDAIDIYDCDVICVVAGILEDSEALKASVKYAEEKGRVVVAPVGNSNEEAPDNIYYPAAYDTVIGVGSLDTTLNQVAEFSQRGKAVNILAPGILHAPLMSGREDIEIGTSVSCAVVAGAAARLKEQAPETGAEVVRDILYTTADDMEEAGYDENTGWGALNLKKALSKMMTE